MALKLEVRDRTEGRALRIGTNGLPHYPAPTGEPGAIGVASPSSRVHHDIRSSAHTERWGRGEHAADKQGGQANSQTRAVGGRGLTRVLEATYKANTPHKANNMKRRSNVRSDLRRNICGWNCGRSGGGNGGTLAMGWLRP